MRDNQGAVVCQEWPGPLKGLPSIPAEHFFSADDLDADAELHGMIAFFYSCFGAGCPAKDDFGFLRKAGHKGAFDFEDFAERDFLAALPQRMLTHPKGGALAVVGHVDRAWESSFFSRNTSRTSDYESLFHDLMHGKRLGQAMEYLNSRYAELGANLSEELLYADGGLRQDYLKLVELWLSRNDARNYLILGDPAVRLFPQPWDVTVSQRAEIKIDAHRTPAGIPVEDWFQTPQSVRDLVLGLLAEKSKD
jgi:hypothetical protein